MKILLIDDDLGCLKVLESTLRQVNYECVSYQDPVEGMAAYRADQYDVLITDIKMPRMNGIDVLKMVKEHDSAAKVIMLSGYADIDTTQSALNQGAYAYFQKPLVIADIFDILQKIEKELSAEKEIKRKIRKFDETESELNLTYQDLQNHIVAVDQLHIISKKIHAATDLNHIMDELVNSASHLLDCQYCLISFFENKFGKCHCHYGGKVTRGEICVRDSCILEKPPFEYCFKQQKILLDNDPSLEVQDVLKPLSIAMSNFVCVPLIRNGQALGVLAGLNKKAGFSGEDKFMLNAISDMAVTAIFNSSLIGKLKELFGQTIEALARGIEVRDKYTRGHTSRVSGFINEIGRALGWNNEKLYEAYIGSTLHDIGKIGIPDGILNKPGRLSPEEFELIKKHVVFGVEILKGVSKLNGMMDYIQHHHERYDGLGYPLGLKGEGIPLEGRVMCVADSFDAMTSNRPYRSHLTINRATAELERCSGTQFDPNVIKIFISLLDSGQFDNILEDSRCIENEPQKTKETTRNVKSFFDFSGELS